jgi:hypothetical protein
MDTRGEHRFSSLVKQNKKGKNCAVFCFAGKRKILFYILRCDCEAKNYKRSSNYYLFLEARAGVALTQELEGRPILGELLRDTGLGRDDGLREMLGLLVLRGGRRRGGHLTPHECQMKAVELR